MTVEAVERQGQVEVDHESHRPRRIASGEEYVVEPFEPGALAWHATPEEVASPSPPWQSYNLSQTFLLHSNPTANHTIFLDIDGHTTTGTLWNSNFNSGQPIVTPSWSLDSDANSFSNTELATIQNIWQRVAEDYAPFNVDVTTQQPSIEDLRRTGGGDTRWGVRVVIGPNTWFSPAGGVAYLNSFNWNSDTPVFVFNTSEISVAEAASHEAGHALNLYHDGNATTDYYTGHGSGATSWAPIMGVSYSRSLTQWSRGEYSGANNKEDDLAIITTNNGFGYRADDVGSTIAAAVAINSFGSTSIGPAYAVIERSSDIDVFSFSAGAGAATIAVDPLAIGANLDILAELYDAAGTLLASSNPAGSLNASLSLSLPSSGTYYLAVSGVGLGDPLGTGYSDYASLGNFRVSGTVQPSGTSNNPPEISVEDGAAVLSDGSSSVGFGSTLIGTPLQKTFTVRNLGDQSLTLTGPITVPTGFTVSSFGATSLAGGASTTFTVTLSATATGSYSGTLSFANSDSNENPFDFTISGTVNPPPPPPPVVQIIDDGDAGFGTAGSWTTYAGEGRGSDIRFSTAGSGADTATWTFSVTPGVYRVSATWSIHSNRATNSPFTVTGGASPVTVLINQELSPNDFTDSGSNWEDLATVNVAGSTITVRLTDAANEYVIADAIRIARIDEADIAVEVDGGNVSDNSGSVGFGSVPINSAAVVKTFTVRNVGTQPLTLSGPVSVPAGFSASAFGATNLAPNGSTTFTVTMATNTAGSFSGSLSFANNDPDENPFNFTISGTVTPPPPTTQIIDDGDTGFATVGSWSTYAGEGRNSDVRFSAAGSGTDIATWTFSVTPGVYRVSATWSIHTNRATNSPFTITGGPSPVTVLVNQELPPNDFTDSGSSWKDLSTVNVAGNTLTVQLTDAANEYVLADAIRIARIDEADVAVEVDGGNVSDNNGSVSFGTVANNSAAVVKTFTVRNVGTRPLTLNNPISVPAGFTASNFGATSLAPAGSTTFTVTMATSTAGTFSGVLSFANNDPDENPFNFTISGTVNPPPATTQIIDDGDSGHSQVGSWTTYAGEGRNSDVRFSAAGSGADTATWTFTVQPGLYRVSATWSIHTNRATNAPFTVTGGASPVTVLINQELTPNDLTASGSTWEDLATISVSGSTITVRLTDQANEYVIADAIRVERIGAAAAPPNSGGSDSAGSHGRSFKANSAGRSDAASGGSSGRSQATSAAAPDDDDSWPLVDNEDSGGDEQDDLLEVLARGRAKK